MLVDPSDCPRCPICGNLVHWTPSRGWTCDDDGCQFALPKSFPVSIEPTEEATQAFRNMGEDVMVGREIRKAMPPGQAFQAASMHIPHNMIVVGISDPGEPNPAEPTAPQVSYESCFTCYFESCQECHRHAPVICPENPTIPTWPAVILNEVNWCGDYEVKK